MTQAPPAEIDMPVSDVDTASHLIEMDADYARNLLEDGTHFTTFEQGLFVLATVVSRP